MANLSHTAEIFVGMGKFKPLQVIGCNCEFVSEFEEFDESGRLSDRQNPNAGNKRLLIFYDYPIFELTSVIFRY